MQQTVITLALANTPAPLHGRLLHDGGSCPATHGLGSEPHYPPAESLDGPDLATHRWHPACARGADTQRRIRAVGITMTDLNPDPRQNFVFGQASAGDRAGAYTFAHHVSTLEDLQGFGARGLIGGGFVIPRLPEITRPASHRKQERNWRIGAEGGIRTPTLLRASAPQAGASASSATSARGEVVSPQLSVVSDWLPTIG
jgi:hypothetical protein